MQESIEPIIHKAAVIGLEISFRESGLSIGDVAELHLQDDGQIAVYAVVSRRGFLIRRRRLTRIGYLGPQAGPLLLPALRKGDYLRVRVVGLTPEHLAPDGRAEMSISVWGNISHLLHKKTKPLAAQAEPRHNSG